jgi:tetratricopeptide (TPR) repeat protein
MTCREITSWITLPPGRFGTRRRPSVIKACAVVWTALAVTGLAPAAELDTRPTWLSVAEPKRYNQESLSEELRRRLSPGELDLLVNPLSSTPEMDRWARGLTQQATNSLQMAEILFDALSSHTNVGPPQFQWPPTAQQVFAAWTNSGTSISCQDLSFLYVALARAAGLRAYHVVVEQDCFKRRVDHGCAAVFVSDKALLVDPAYSLFGAGHTKFRVLDDVQTSGLYACSTGKLDLCQAAAKLAPDLSIVQLSLFGGLARQGRWAEAENCLSAISRLDPDGPSTCVARGEIAAHAGNLEEATKLLRKAVELAPEIGSVHFAIADVYGRAGDLAGARRECHEALRNAYYGQFAAAAEGTLAFIDATECQAKGDWDGVLTNCEKTIEFRPDYPPAYFGRGTARYLKGDIASATADYQQAARLDPRWLPPLQMLGYIFYERHDFTESLAAFRKVSTLDPTNDYSHFRIWLARSRIGETSSATAELESYLNRRPRGSGEDWPAKIGTFLVGKMAEPEFLRVAASGDKERSAVQSCDALFYAGTKRLLAGDKDTARRYFEECVASGDKRFAECTSAAAELHFLRADKLPNDR